MKKYLDDTYADRSLGGRHTYSVETSDQGSNCQSNTIARMAKCCLKSSWKPSPYAGDPKGRCIKSITIAAGYLSRIVCIEWEFDKYLGQ